MKEIMADVYYVAKEEIQMLILSRGVRDGLGIPENVVTLCPDCHYQEDFGKNCKWYEARIEEYLQNYYGKEWNKENLIYKKW
jgi:hypothetical protein